MGRTVITILLIGVIFWGFHQIRQLWARRHQSSRPAFAKTVQCARCGVYVDLRLAHEHRGQHYCCREHLP